ncbi:MAG: Cof-type HAD-IIB family hydrolase [Clostridiales bacterium]|nr:Cof-type HAD-IIB family hydrolase [Clostridiales bacterium]
MNKFKGLLLCTDLDDTILTRDKRISDKNIEAIKYFMSEGGLFTFATGRVPGGVKPLLKYIVPNAPMVCFNGGGIYDIEKKKELWAAELDGGAQEVIKYIADKYPFAGVEICTQDKIYFCRRNRIVNEHQKIENFEDNDMPYTEVPKPWRKVLFMVEEEQLPLIREAILKSPYADKYTYVQSSPWYYEILPKGNTKGEGLLRLAALLGIKPENTIGMGDNENDLDLVKKAGLGVAVANASDAVKAAADRITVDNESDAVAEVIYSLEKSAFWV